MKVLYCVVPPILMDGVHPHGLDWTGKGPGGWWDDPVVPALKSSMGKHRQPRHMDVKSLLLQTGLLTLSQPRGDSKGAVYCEVPNEYARKSLKTMLESVLGDEIRWLSSELVAALEERDPKRFTSTLRLLGLLPYSLKARGPSKLQGLSAEEEGNPLEAWARR